MDSAKLRSVLRLQGVIVAVSTARAYGAKEMAATIDLGLHSVCNYGSRYFIINPIYIYTLGLVSLGNPNTFHFLFVFPN